MKRVFLLKSLIIVLADGDKNGDEFKRLKRESRCEKKYDKVKNLDF